MTRRSEREAAQRRRYRLYESALAGGALLLGGGLLVAFGLVLYATVLAPAAPPPRPGDLRPGLVGSYGRALTRVDPRIEFEAGDLPFAEHEAVQWTGYLRVPLDGRYTFSVSPPGSATLDIGGRRVQGAAELAAGHHALRLAYSRGEGARELRLYWESDARPREVIPPHSLFHESGAPRARR